MRKETGGTADVGQKERFNVKTTSVASILGLKYDLIFVLRSQCFEYFALTFVQTGLGAPGNGKRLAIIDLFDGL